MNPSVDSFDPIKYQRLMDGLECNELTLNKVKQNNELFRFDAEYFNKKAIKVIDSIISNKFSYLGEVFNISKLAGFEFTSHFTEENLNSDNSYIALTSKNIQTEELSILEYITIDKTVADENLKRSKLNINDVVLSYTGEYRRALTLRYDNYQLGPNVCRLTPKKKNVLSFYYSAFLNSKTGQTILDREKTLSAQPTVAMQRIRLIPVPEIDDDMENKIRILSNLYYKNLDNSEEFLNEANRVLENVLEQNVIIDENNVSTVPFSKMNKQKRFDSEYYQPKYQSIKEIIKKYKNGYKYFNDVCKLKDFNYIPEDDKEYEYIELSNVNKDGFITGATKKIGSELPTRARRRVFKGDVIISSIEGSLETCALIDKEYNGALCSTGFYVLESKIINSETLYVLFKNKYLQSLLKQECSGTILSNITKDNLNNIILPIIEDEIQNTIKDLVIASHEAMRKSKDIYNEIILLVENKYAI